MISASHVESWDCSLNHYNVLTFGLWRPLFRDLNNRGAVISLLIAQIVSASYFYTASSVYSYMASDLGENVSGLGVLTTAFILGIGPFQVPAGILSAKVGPRKTIIYGTTLASAATLVTSLPSQLATIAFLRFLTGVGMAFMFAPGITLVAKYFRKGSEGLGIGLFTGAFDLGGIIVIPGWAVLGQVAGWRLSFAATGILGLITAASLILFVPSEKVESRFQLRISDLKKVLLNKWLLLIGLATLSVQVGWNTVGSFMVFYLEDKFGVVPGFAGLVGSLFLISALLFSPLSGRLYGRIGRPVRTLFAAGLISGLGLASTAFTSASGAAIFTLAVGAAAGVGFTTAYILAREVNESEPRYETLGVSWVNGISLFGGFWTPVLFSYSAVNFGYPAAWLVSGAVSVPLIVPILKLKMRKAEARVVVTPGS